MRRDLLERAMSGILPHEPTPPAGEAVRSERQRGQRVVSKTTLVVLAYGQGLMCAADRQTTSWFSVYANDSEKIRPVSPLAVLLGSGDVGSIQRAEEYLVRVNKSVLTRYGHFLSMPGLANVFRQWLRRVYQREYDFMCYSILAGISPNGDYRIYDFETDGSFHEFSDYVTSGSGGEQAQVILDDQWKPDLSFKEAVELAVRAVSQAGMRDLGSSDARIAIPRVVPINHKLAGPPIPDSEVIRAVVNVMKEKKGIFRDLAIALAEAIKNDTRERERRSKKNKPAEHTKEQTDVGTEDKR